MTRTRGLSLAAIIITLLLLPLALEARIDPRCESFEVRLKKTYGFRPSQLDASSQDAKAKAMDAIWTAVKEDPATLVPCLKSALAQPTQDGWFLYDGNQLLLSVAPSREVKQALLDALGRVSLDDVDLRSWVATTSALGTEGFDTSALGRRWLAYPKAAYSLPEHGGYIVDRENGAMFIFGAEDETFATPALTEICRTSTGEVKEIAAWLLMSQATRSALQAVATLNTDGLSPKAIASRAALLRAPDLIIPRNPPRTTRKEFLEAFSALLAGDQAPFDHLVQAVPDGERDLVAVVNDTDLDTIRRVRRWFIARNNQHAIEYYNQFCQILMTLVWKPEVFHKDVK